MFRTFHFGRFLLVITGYFESLATLLNDRIWYGLCKNADTVLKSASLCKICQRLVISGPEICVGTRFLFRF